MGERKAAFDKLGKMDSSCKVWVGSLPYGLTWKDLEKHFETTATVKPTTTHIMSYGKAVAGFSTPEEAAAAIASCNGSTLKGKEIQCEPWSGKKDQDEAAAAGGDQKMVLVNRSCSEAVWKARKSGGTMQIRNWVVFVTR